MTNETSETNKAWHNEGLNMRFVHNYTNLKTQPSYEILIQRLFSVRLYFQTAISRESRPILETRVVYIRVGIVLFLDNIQAIIFIHWLIKCLYLPQIYRIQEGHERLVVQG